MAYELANRDKHLIVFARGQLLELLRWVATCSSDEPNDGETFEDEAHRDRLLAAIAVAGAIWNSRVMRGVHEPPSDGEERLALQISLTRRQALDNATAPEFHQLFGRSLELWEKHLPNRLPGFDLLFKDEVGLTLREFILITRLFYFYFIEHAESQPDGLKSNTGVFDYEGVGRKTAVHDKIQLYLRQFSLTLDDLASTSWGEDRPSTDAEFMQAFQESPALRLGALRDRPILRSTDGRCIIVDPYFLSEFLLTAPLFRIPREARGAAFKAYGYAFEDYAIATIERFVPRSALAKRIATNENIPTSKKTKREVDAIVGSPKGGIIFEIKHSFLEDELVAPGLEAKLVAQLRERFGGDRKGTGQLARTFVLS
ncbi:MAG: hypothetical protein EP329_00350 [Deltaproteobacteria bacterium]|nr:MAG: hypothetical protein EP329_00350 [Deltaproteobacteria bacterium]